MSCALKKSNANASFAKSPGHFSGDNSLTSSPTQISGRVPSWHCCIVLQFSSLNHFLIDQSDKTTEKILSWFPAKMATLCNPNYPLIRIIFSVPFDSIYAVSTVSSKRCFANNIRNICRSIDHFLRNMEQSSAHIIEESFLVLPYLKNFQVLSTKSPIKPRNVQACPCNHYISVTIRPSLSRSHSTSSDDLFPR